MSPTEPKPTRFGGDSPIWPLVRGELRMLLRDKRTIFASVLLPLIFLPVVFFLSHLVEKKREERIETQTFHYAVAGTEADFARGLLAETQPKGDEADAPGEPGERGSVHLEEKEVDDPEAALAARDIHAYVVALTPEEARQAAEAEAAEADEAEADEADEAESGAEDEADAADDPSVDLALPAVHIYFQGDWDNSQTAAAALSRRFGEARTRHQGTLLSDAGFPVARQDVAAVAEIRDLATAGQRGGRVIGRFAVLALMLFLLAGGSVVAADTLAGEKERGTLETLLTSAATRTEIVVAKLLVIVTVGLFIACVQIANLLVYVGLDLIDLPDAMAVEVTPVSALWLLLLIAPLVVLVSAALLLVSGRSKTYKEFQVNFFPVFVLLVAPAAASLLPAIDLRSAIVLMPISNLAVAVREVLVGEIDWLFLPLAVLVSAGAAWVLVRQTLRALHTERLITAAEVDQAEFLGGPAIFPRRVLLLFGVLWVVMFSAANGIEALQTIRAQILFNVIGLFGCGALLMVWRYRLDPKKALALRAPHPLVWPAILLGAPAFLLTAIAVGRLSNALFPVPAEMLESFGQALLPDGFPLWQVYLFLCVAPGICEELAFRGVLLHGLRRRFAPWQLCLITGLVFGLFHMSLFRILPTATLGVALAAVTLLTGSIYPAMVWHALNNAIALTLGHQGVDITDLPTTVYAASGVVTAVVFAFLWRIRRPYPGLKGSGPEPQDEAPRRAEGPGMRPSL